MNVAVRALDADDFGYALSSWRESHKQAPGVDRLPWPYYRAEWGEKFRAIINDPGTLLLGAYSPTAELPLPRKATSRSNKHGVPNG